jgi:hypothetical protein
MDIQNLGQMQTNNHTKDAIFTGLRTAAELPSLNLNDTRYMVVACPRDDAGLFLSALGVTIGRPKKSRAGCVTFFRSRSVLRRKREKEGGTDLFHGVHIDACRLISFPWWLVCDGGRYEHPFARALGPRRVVPVRVFGSLPSATKERRRLCRFRSLDYLHMTDGELSVDLREQAVSEKYRRRAATGSQAVSKT